MSCFVRNLQIGTSSRLVSATAVGRHLPKNGAVYASLGQQGWIASNLRQYCCKQKSRSNRGSRKFSICAAWGDDIVWSPATIVKTQQAAEGFHTILLDVGAKAAKVYNIAGQYLQVRLKGSKPGFYAIASSPDNSKDGVFQLLVRRRGENSEELCQVEAGTEVEASPVDGPGFRIGQIGPDVAPQVFIFATGSGISPIKALIESGTLQAEQRKTVELYWGTQNADATPFKQELKGWESHGVKVNHVYSKDGLGYVQDVFEQENAFQDGSKVAVILCGHKDMSEILTKQMQSAGVSKEKILTNY